MSETSFIFPNDAHPTWSIMIVLYPYITGLVAGAFVVSSLYHVFHREVLKPVARLALITSFCFCSFATLPLLLHLHHPERCLNIAVTPSATSAMAGFGFIYSTYMLVLIVEVWLVCRPSIVARAKQHSGLKRAFYTLLALGVTTMTDGARAVDQKLIRALAIMGIPIACVLHGYVGFLFGAVKANPWWSTALMPVIFLASAIVSGIAALVVLYLFICWWRGEQPDDNCVRALARYMWLFLVLAVTLEGLELLQMSYEAGGEWHTLRTLVTDKLAVSYGIIQVLIGSVLPLVILLPAFSAKLGRRFVMFCSGLGASLILIQVLAMRWNVVVGGQLFSKSFRGFVEFPMHWMGREGLIAGAIVLMLPLVTLWIVSKIVPIRAEDEVLEPSA
ncbi:MAG: polysulfide reductase NrfD [Planctomycetales bacterium]|nr:polysulfide reductase NrfD [Planctomycetales bacterium]